MTEIQPIEVVTVTVTHPVVVNFLTNRAGEYTYRVTGHSRSLLSHFPQVTVVNLYLAMAAEWTEAQDILSTICSSIMLHSRHILYSSVCPARQPYLNYTLSGWSTPIDGAQLSCSCPSGQNGKQAVY